MKRHIATLATVMLLAGAALFSMRAEAAGNQLQVTVAVTITQSFSIAWGAATSVDDHGVVHSGDIAPFNWIAKNSAGANLGLNQTIISSDNNNGNKVIMVACLSPTGSTADISAKVTKPAQWSIGTAPGSDTFAVSAMLDTTEAPLSSTTAAPLGAVTTGTDKALVLSFTTPTALTKLAGSEQVICVTLTAAAR
jgi:hypothetical protein